MLKNLLKLFFLVPILFGCDELTRFKQEKLECRTTNFGVVDLIIKKRKIGSDIALSARGVNHKLKINLLEGERIIGVNNEASVDINVKTKKVILRMDNSVETLRCKHHNFKM